MRDYGRLVRCRYLTLVVKAAATVAGVPVELAHKKRRAGWNIKWRKTRADPTAINRLYMSNKVAAKIPCPIGRSIWSIGRLRCTDQRFLIGNEKNHAALKYYFRMFTARRRTRTQLRSCQVAICYLPRVWPGRRYKSCPSPVSAEAPMR